jgi:hypothetical protein
LGNDRTYVELVGRLKMSALAGKWTGGSGPLGIWPPSLPGNPEQHHSDHYADNQTGDEIAIHEASTVCAKHSRWSDRL